MKPNTPILITAMVLFAALASPAPLSGQHSRYKLVDLGTFGGPSGYVNIPDNSYARILDNRRTVAGWADTPTPDDPPYCFNDDCFVSHALKSRNGITIDLGVLPGGASSSSSWISANGLIAGTSQNGQIDPLIPGPPFFPEFRAVLWPHGEITDLGTLPEGGYESQATAVNSHGVVVGFATNTNNNDSNSMFGFNLQTRAFRWDKDSGMQDLGTLGDGTDAIALLINERGQVVGDSYTSSNPSAYCGSNLELPLTTGVFLWENGNMKDLGNFGGTCTFAFALNSRGEVVGASTTARDEAQHPFLWDGRSMKDLGTFGGNFGNAIAISDTGKIVGWATYPRDTVYHAALWSEAGMTDLGTLPGDVNSFVADINARDQVIGTSVDSTFNSFRAFLWENGHMLDLEPLLASSGLQLGFGVANINDHGEITGNAIDTNNHLHAILLVPCAANDSTCQDASADLASRPAPAGRKPANDQTRRMLRRRLAPLYKVPVLSTPTARSAATSSGVPTAEEGTTKISSSAPNLLDSLDADRIRFSTTSSCAGFGMPCSPNGGYPRCCGTLKCEFHGGSTRVGYMCE